MRPLYGHFHNECCEFFNLVENLLRKVLKCSLEQPYYRMGRTVLNGIWSKYADLIHLQFSESQKRTLIEVSLEIGQANVYVLLDGYRPDKAVAVGPWRQEMDTAWMIDLSQECFSETIRSIMLQVFEFEQEEMKLFLGEGCSVRLEPYLLSLFWSQVKDGPPTFALLLLKWWARLHFVLP